MDLYASETAIAIAREGIASDASAPENQYQYSLNQCLCVDLVDTVYQGIIAEGKEIGGNTARILNSALLEANKQSVGYSQLVVELDRFTKMYRRGGDGIMEVHCGENKWTPMIPSSIYLGFLMGKEEEDRNKAIYSGAFHDVVVSATVVHKDTQGYFVGASPDDVLKLCWEAYMKDFKEAKTRGPLADSGSEASKSKLDVGTVQMVKNDQHRFALESIIGFALQDGPIASTGRKSRKIHSFVQALCVQHATEAIQYVRGYKCLTDDTANFLVDLIRKANAQSPGYTQLPESLKKLEDNYKRDYLGFQKMKIGKKEWTHMIPAVVQLGILLSVTTKQEREEKAFDMKFFHWIIIKAAEILDQTDHLLPGTPQDDFIGLYLGKVELQVKEKSGNSTRLEI